MTTAVTDKVMAALELASQSVPAARQGWTTPGEVDSFADEVGYKPYITWQKLDILVKEERAEKEPGGPEAKYLYRPLKVGGMMRV